MKGEEEILSYGWRGPRMRTPIEIEQYLPTETEAGSEDRQYEKLPMLYNVSAIASLQWGSIFRLCGTNISLLNKAVGLEVFCFLHAHMLFCFSCLIMSMAGFFIFMVLLFFLSIGFVLCLNKTFNRLPVVGS